jgi:phospholipase D1/2
MTKAPLAPGRATFGIVILIALLGCAAAWHWTPLNHWVNFETVAAWERSFNADPAAPYIIVGAYLLAAFLFFPITVLTAVTIFTFGPVTGNFYSLVGWLLSAGAGYGMGRLMGRDWLRNLVGYRLDYWDRGAQRNGLLTVLALRVVPVAPFTVVNLFFGASRIRLRDFLLGSVIGRLPGLIALTLFEVQIKSLLRAPATGKVALMAVLLLSSILAHRWLSQQFVPAEQRIGPKARINLMAATRRRKRWLL